MADHPPSPRLADGDDREFNASPSRNAAPVRSGEKRPFGDLDDDEENVSASKKEFRRKKKRVPILRKRPHAHPLDHKFAKIERMLKQLFCFQQDMEKRMYEAHRSSKLIRSGQKKIMRALSIEVDSGSESNLTPFDEWQSVHNRWDEDDASSSIRRPPPRHDDDIAKEEEDDEDEDSDGSE